MIRNIIIRYFKNYHFVVLDCEIYFTNFIVQNKSGKYGQVTDSTDTATGK